MLALNTGGVRAIKATNVLPNRENVGFKLHKQSDNVGRDGSHCGKFS